VNTKRILLAGLAAGAFIAVTDALMYGVVLAEQSEAMMAELGLAYASWAIPAFIIIAFVFGLLLAWLYAAIRPRYGPGWETALRAAAFIWVVGALIPNIWFMAVGLAPPSPTLAMVAWVFSLVQIGVAAAVAGWLYQEEPAAAQAAAPLH
jgi:hypothetical protein